MAKRKATKPRAKAALTPRGEIWIALLFSTTTAWRRVSSKETTRPVEDAINDLSAAGLIEVRIVAAVEMGNQKLPRCRYVGGGEWWTLLEKELDRLVPATWRGAEGKPNQSLLQRANVTAIRLTSEGCEFVAAGKGGTIQQWIARQPKKKKAENYLRCDGIDSRPAAVSFTPSRGVAPRDDWFLKQYNARGTDTYRKPAKIHARWKGMNVTDRAAVCPDSPNLVTKAAVAKAILRSQKKLRKPKQVPQKSK